VTAVVTDSGRKMALVVLYLLSSSATSFSSFIPLRQDKKLVGNLSNL